MHILIWDIFFIFFISFIFSSEICFSALIEMRRAGDQQTTAHQCAHCAGSQQINRSKRFIGHLVWWILASHFSFPFYSSSTEVTSTSTFLHRPPPATETWGNKQYLYADLGWVFFFKQKITGFQYIAQWSPHPKTSRGLSLASLRSLTGEDDLRVLS